MSPLVLSLIFVPWVAAILVLLTPKSLYRALVVVTALVLSGLSLAVFWGGSERIAFAVPEVFNKVMLVLDVAMLAYFAFVAWKHRSWVVGILTGLQLGLLLSFLSMLTQTSIPHEAQFLVDKLSMFMYLLINIVSGIICVYALKYIDDEPVSEQRKKNFIAILLWFVGVMNFIVSVDNIEWFFLLFEATTLASFWLIRFRGDSESVKNALRALWMNQIGGVSILSAILVLVSSPSFHTLAFSELVSKTPVVGLMLPVALISVAALIKGAQMPFSSWLMGAMIAPTPVSALLHSSTMVKIAPFIILRLSPALKGTTLSYAIMLLAAFVFLVSAVGSLAKDSFKLVLAHSTIALLALMILLAAIGSEISILAALFLVLFHGISKCLLFLQAGTLERVFHAKYVSSLQKIGETGPFTTFCIGIGFLSLMLPPFGAFVGKWLAVELFAQHMKASSAVVGVLLVISILIGSAVLSVLYFRVMGMLVMRSGNQDVRKGETLSPYYVAVPLLLITLIIGGVLGLAPLTQNVFLPVVQALGGAISGFSISPLNISLGVSNIPLWVMYSALIILPFIFWATGFVTFKADRVKEYTCGEKIDLEYSAYYFSFEKLTPIFIGVGIVFFISIVLIGRLPL